MKNKTFSKPSNPKTIPPAILKSESVMERTFKIAVLEKTKIKARIPAIKTALFAVFANCSLLCPCVNAKKEGKAGKWVHYDKYSNE